MPFLYYSSSGSFTRMSSDESDSDCDGGTRSVVIDHGSDTIKAGLSGNKYPDIIFPTIVGYPKQQVSNIIFLLRYGLFLDILVIIQCVF